MNNMLTDEEHKQLDQSMAFLFSIKEKIPFTILGIIKSVIGKEFETRPEYKSRTLTIRED